jgi:hypothetical protein
MQDKNIFTRIADSPQDFVLKTQEYLLANNISKAKNRNELASKLAKLYKVKGTDIVPDLVGLHPDSEFFKNYYEDLYEKKIEDLTEKIETLKQNYSNDCGCGGGNKYNNDAGNSNLIPFADKASTAKDYMPILATISVVGLLAITIVSINKR